MLRKKDIFKEIYKLRRRIDVLEFINEYGKNGIIVNFYRKHNKVNGLPYYSISFKFIDGNGNLNEIDVGDDHGIDGHLTYSRNGRYVEIFNREADGVYRVLDVYKIFAFDITLENKDLYFKAYTDRKQEYQNIEDLIKSRILGEKEC